MYNRDDLNTLAEQVRAAQEAVDQARAGVAQDKLARAVSLRARLVDVFTTTEAEQQLHAAEATLAAG